MKFLGTLNNPVINTYYVTGSIDQKMENSSLQKMLSKIEKGGISALLNEPGLNKFAQGLISSFRDDGYIKNDNTLTDIAKDVIKTGKAWRGLQGAFIFTVLEYGGERYLLNAELVSEKNLNDKDEANFSSPTERYAFLDTIYQGIEFEYQNIHTDANWAKIDKKIARASVTFSFDYELKESEVSVSWFVGGAGKTCKFVTTDNSVFSILKSESAMRLLRNCEKKEDVFNFFNEDTTAIQLEMKESSSLDGKKWLSSFFINGAFAFEDVQYNETEKGKIDDVRLYIAQDDAKSVSLLLNEYLLHKAEESYLGYEEVGRLVSAFQDLFKSRDGKTPACPTIEEETKDIYDELVECAKKNSEKNPIAYLHLQAYIDLSPVDTIKPYIKKNESHNLTNKMYSFSELVTTIFGQQRTVESICIFSKYAAINARNARALILFAESVKKVFGTKITLITAYKTTVNKEYEQSNKKWYTRLKKSVNVIERQEKEINSIHDRYYKVVRLDGETEWWVMTGELDSIRFENDNPRIREDIGVDEQGRVKEMTISRLKESGIPNQLLKLMEAK